MHTFKWYKGLYDYSRPGVDKIAEERELGPDGDLVTSMISTAVIPIIRNVIDNGALDVYSQHDIRRIIDLAAYLISLSVSKREDMQQGPHPESRLMREEDELGEGDDGIFQHFVDTCNSI